MLENLNYLFEYLKREQINIDKSEFEFQIQSHPDYRSLVSIVDTLNFFNIDNGILSVETSEIELLPEFFVALLKIENSKPQFYLVEKKGDFYCYSKDKKRTVLSKQELEITWKNTVLLVEKSKTDNFIENNKRKSFGLLPFLCIGFFFLMLMKFQVSTEIKLFFVFTILGVLFSIAALKDLFDTKSELLNSFCNVTASTSCNAVVSSNKWKIFEIVNFSDLSMVFYSSQFLGLLLFLFMGDATVYFAIQEILLLAAVPVLFLSVYYQKFVEKKWCPVCLVIIAIILLELIYILILLRSSFNFSISSLIVFGFVFTTVILIWSALKKLLILKKDLKEFQIKGNRFMRNYEIFKNTLLASSQIEDDSIQSGVIFLGNVDAPLKIKVVTSPFCGFCKQTHTIIEEIIEKYPKKVCFDIRFNFDDENTNINQKSKKVHQQLVSIYFNQGQEAFMKALHNWFENKDENKFKIIENSIFNEFEVNQILAEQFNWNQVHQINYTPAIIINGYFLPKQYDKNDLIHFVNDLYEDEDFNK